MSLRNLLLLGQLVLPALAILHEQLAAVPHGWTLAQEADDSTPITLSVALVQQNLDQLESKLSTVSTPGGAEYGKWLDVDDVNALFPVVSDSNVVAWLQSNGISTIHRTGSAVNFATTVGTANKLLNTNFAYYSSGTTHKLRTTQYSIPDNLAGDIDLISPTTYFGKTAVAGSIVSFTTKDGVAVSSTESAPSQVSVDASCQTSVTPPCLKQLYSVGDYTPDPAAGSRIGFGSFLNQSAIYSDLAQFEQHFDIPSQNFSVELINGATNDQNISTAGFGEADLDVEMMVGVSHPLPVTEFITGGSP
jgi:tripeptidyl-peptidase-1